LAAAVAHEVNQSLMAAGTYARLVADTVSSDASAPPPFWQSPRSRLRNAGALEIRPAEIECLFDDAVEGNRRAVAAVEPHGRPKSFQSRRSARAIRLHSCS
jgi:hypothetical protein